MTPRNRLLPAFLTLASVFATVQPSQLAAQSPVPAYLARQAPNSVSAHRHAGGYDAAVVGDRYATPAAYHSYAPLDTAFSPAAAHVDVRNEGQQVTAIAPIQSEPLSQSSA